MPCDYSKYPANWLTEIRPAILRRAWDRCESCKLKNYSLALSKSRVSLTKPFPNFKAAAAEVEWYHEPDDKAIVIVLTIAHLDHDTENNDPANLKALCQRCHLLHDREHHRRSASRTRARYSADQFELFTTHP